MHTKYINHHCMYIRWEHMINFKEIYSVDPEDDDPDAYILGETIGIEED